MVSCVLQLQLQAGFTIGLFACTDSEKDEGVRASGQDLQAHVPILCQSEGSAW